MTKLRQVCRRLGIIAINTLQPRTQTTDMHLYKRILCVLSLPLLSLKLVAAQAYLSPHSEPILAHGDYVYVTNTPAHAVEVLDAQTGKPARTIQVGIEPVSIAIRPDGKEIWVSNHISDSVSVIDNVSTSPTYHRVVGTIQQMDLESRSTRFDEPVGIAFASNKKAYVALSSENKIAIVDVQTRKVTGHLRIPAQDPRAIKVRDGKLYVLPFESSNKTQLSGGKKQDIDGKLVTFDAWEHSIRHNNILSIGHVTDIVKHPKFPDYDLFIFDTKTDKILRTVDTVGTLLYGMAVDSRGQAYIAQADARNHANGRAGTKKHGLAELENRPFLNRITQVPAKGKPKFLDLEPLPPKQPAPGSALATPFAIQLSKNEDYLLATAASSGKFFTVSTKSGKVLGQVETGNMPRGIAIDQAGQAWVYNVGDNTVSVLDLSKPAAPKVKKTLTLEDPTKPDFKEGRIAFNTARASTTGTFSCASCHPDGHTDQLLWVLTTPIVTGGNQIQPRSTMPVRGLQDTAPFHWDGIPGDPYGGRNSAHIHGNVEPNSDINDETTSTRDLVNGGLANTMALPDDKTTNDEGKPGLLDKKERDAMAKFLLQVPYPPAQRRPYTNKLTERAEKGFELFHILGNYEEDKPRPNVCGDCHRMPFWVSTNTPGSGMDAPTWRGAYDRFLILPQGRLNIIEFPFYKSIADKGNDERSMWRLTWRSKPRFDPVWDMVLEGSTGDSGTFARQFTLDQSTAGKPLAQSLLPALVTAGKEGSIQLKVEGTLLEKGKGENLSLILSAKGFFLPQAGSASYSLERLQELAQKGKFTGTFSAHAKDYQPMQPALWTLSEIHAQSGRQEFPVIHKDKKAMALHARHIGKNLKAFVDGSLAPAKITRGKGEVLNIELSTLPKPGIHFLQIQSNGRFSNDFLFHVSKGAEDAAKIHLAGKADQFRKDIEIAIYNGNLQRVKKLVADGADINGIHPDYGSTPLSTAAFHGQLAITRWLLNNGADATKPNRDGNTPLHVAAFLCQEQAVQLLLAKGASIKIKNKDGNSPLESVSSEWSTDLENIYKGLDQASRLELDMDTIQTLRPKLAAKLRKHG